MGARGRVVADESKLTPEPDLDAAKLEVGLATSVGRVRSANEDSVLCEPVDSPDVEQRGLFCVVADGMGGHAGGDVASSIAVQKARDVYYTADVDTVEEALMQAIETANRDVFAESHGKTGRDQMGSTMTAVVVLGAKAVVGHVGDSRCYLVEDGELKQITRDHSWVSDEVQAGALTPEEARVHPRRNLITRALGLRPDVEVDVHQFSLKPGSVVLVCSDGLHGPVGDEEILAQLQRLPPQEAVDSLISLANERGGPDNISAVVIKAGDDHQSDTVHVPVAAAEQAADEQTQVVQDRGAAGATGRYSGAPDHSGAVPPTATQPTRRRSIWRPVSLVALLLALLVVNALIAWLVFGPGDLPIRLGAEPNATAVPPPLAATPIGAAVATTVPISAPTSVPVSPTRGGVGQVRELEIIQDDAPVQAEPRRDASILKRVPAGEPLAAEEDIAGESINESPRWFLVRTPAPDSVQGFVHSSFVREVP